MVSSLITIIDFLSYSKVKYINRHFIFQTTKLVGNIILTKSILLDNFDLLYYILKLNDLTIS